MRTLRHRSRKIKKTFPTTTWTTSTDTTTAAVALVILDSTLSCRWRSVGDMRVFEELKSGFRGDAVKVQISGCRKSPSRRGRCGQLLATSSVLSTRSKVLSIPPRARQIFTVRSLRQRKTGNDVISLLCIKLQLKVRTESSAVCQSGSCTGSEVTTVSPLTHFELTIWTLLFTATVHTVVQYSSYRSSTTSSTTITSA